MSACCPICQTRHKGLTCPSCFPLNERLRVSYAPRELNEEVTRNMAQHQRLISLFWYCVEFLVVLSGVFCFWLLSLFLFTLE